MKYTINTVKTPTARVKLYESGFMNIGIDISMLAYQGTSVNLCTYNLVKQLLLYDKENNYKLFYSSLRRPKNFYYLREFEKLGAKVYNYFFPAKLLWLCWNKYHVLPVEWLVGKVDVYYSSEFLRPPLLKGTQGVTIVHDVIWKIQPQWHMGKTIEDHERKMKKTIQYGDIIITPSDNTKQDLINYYPKVSTNNIVEVMPWPVGDKFKVIKDMQLIKNVLLKYNLGYPKNYLLAVGSIEPRKNLTTAIKVFNQLIKNPKYGDFELLSIGRAGWKNENVFKLIQDLGIAKKVHVVGFVEDVDVPYFYNACRVNVYLSRYEGFGLPPIEAAACNKPTLLYRHSALKELLPENYPFTTEDSELKDLIKLIENKDTNFTHLANKYTWKEYCRKFLEVIANKK